MRRCSPAGWRGVVRASGTGAVLGRVPSRRSRHPTRRNPRSAGACGGARGAGDRGRSWRRSAPPTAPPTPHLARPRSPWDERRVVRGSPGGCSHEHHRNCLAAGSPVGGGDGDHGTVFIAPARSGCRSPRLPISPAGLGLMRAGVGVAADRGRHHRRRDRRRRRPRQPARPTWYPWTLWRRAAVVSVTANAIHAIIAADTDVPACWPRRSRRSRRWCCCRSRTSPWCIPRRSAGGCPAPSIPTRTRAMRPTRPGPSP
jgi:hypothetical protein